MWDLSEKAFADWSGDVLRVASQYGLTISELNTLYEVRAGQSLSLSEIVQRIGLSKSATSQLVERLVQAGLLLRQEDPTSRRQKQVSLTEAGFQITHSLDGLMLDKVAQTLEAVPEAPLQQLYEALEGVKRYTAKQPKPSDA